MAVFTVVQSFHAMVYRMGQAERPLDLGAFLVAPCPTRTQCRHANASRQGATRMQDIGHDHHIRIVQAGEDMCIGPDISEIRRRRDRSRAGAKAISRISAQP
ncbi:hypothetical protein [Ruegeria atlantica]|uniref:hypothetical protein n=1 Tax=Ruegeria atlantica TaxID=81569 RepID=UPI00147A7805|nr:hypothetical protein [Ruegeria atlantica]